MIHFKSLERIDSLGEVYTPIHTAYQMMELISADKWNDPHCIFFEPTCGNGNIVEAIFRRRVNALFNGTLEYAVANTMNTLIAMDVDLENVLETRERVERIASEYIDLGSDLVFYAHFKRALELQITHNDMISALCTEKRIKNHTIIGKAFNREYGVIKDNLTTYLEKIELIQSNRVQ